MTSDDQTKISSDEAILVEYLDDELAMNQRKDVEERLAGDPGFREKLARLEASWQYLDLLDREATDKDLVETTLETVVFDREKSIGEIEKRLGRRFFLKKLGLGFLAFLVFFVAFHVGMRFGPIDNFLAGIAMPIIERLDMYLLVLDSDPEFLRRLTDQRVFLPPLPEGSPPVNPRQYYPSSAVQVLDTFSMRPTFGEMKRRIQKIEKLEKTLYNQYYWNNKRFLEFSWEKKHKLKELHENIEKSPGRHDLIRTLQNYYNWRKSLQSYERNELNSKLPAEEQVEQILALKKRLDAAQPTAYAAPIISNIIKTDQGVGIHELAEELKKLNRRDFERILNAPPDQAISILERSRGVDE